MNAISKLAPAEPMTIEQFLAFTATRPPGERWELIEGVAILNPSPVDWHQHICGNIVGALNHVVRSQGATWWPIIGTGTKTPSSPNSLPQPDVMVKEHPLTGTPASDDALMLVEVLSKGNTRKWREWRRTNYPSIPNCQHYFTVSMKRVEVECYDRSTGWMSRSLTDLSQALDLQALGTSLRLADIYWRTPLEGGAGPDRPRRTTQRQASKSGRSSKGQQ